MVEFALVAPVFFLLVFGMIEYGRMVMVQQILTNASREGARLAVLDGITTGNVTAAVSDYLTARDFDSKSDWYGFALPPEIARQKGMQQA